MNKILLMTAGLLLTASVSLRAADSVIALSSGKEIKVDKVELSKNGDYRYTEGKTTKNLKKSEVKWAWIPKPKSVRAADALLADGKNAEAAEAFEKVGSETRSLGWDIYCRVNQAKALLADNKTEEGKEILNKLVGAKSNPKTVNDLVDGYQILANIYVQAKQYDKALPIIIDLTNSKDDEVACAAFFTKGNILEAKAEDTKDRDDMKNAALAYFQAALLFENASKAPDALLASYRIMKNSKDARAEKFADILRKKYPNSDAVSQLK